MKILITGAAGFIGFHLARRLSKEGHNIIGIDNLNNYYDAGLKWERAERLPITIICKDINVPDFIYKETYIYGKVDLIIHLAAQAGARYSITNPDEYIRTNLSGFYRVLEYCRNNGTRLIYASSSSVYGANTKYPYSENDKTDSPVSLYGATKKANEVMAHSYSEMHGIETTGLRFFTVYGEWGRPDMAPYLFTEAVKKGEPVNLYNAGRMERDFTYIDDVVECIVRIINTEQANPAEIYNIGKGSPDYLSDFLSEIEKNVGKKANVIDLPMQTGDVLRTWADCEKLYNRIGYIPGTGLKTGLKKYVDWHLKYYMED